MIFTEEQKEAILSRGASILVSAGAGSGKTRVLTERLMEYISPEHSEAVPAEIDSFLVITFTRAAADELRSRISEAITARLRNNPTDAHLRRQLILCRTAQIGTIHSFCGRLLREHAAQLGISQSFRILEEEKSEQLRNLALEHVLDTQYEEGADAFLQLADRVGRGRDDSRLQNLVLSLHSALQSHARPEQWIQQQIEQMKQLPSDIAETAWGRELLSDLKETVSFYRAAMESALKDIQTCESICRAYGKSFGETCDALGNLERAISTGWDSCRDCFPIPFPRITGIKNNPDPELSERVKQMRAACKKAMEKAALLFSSDSTELMEEIRSTEPEMRSLLQLTGDLEREFQREKRRINALDFSDLEHLAVRLLMDEDGKPSATAAALSSQFTEIMVDEYQDVSRVQDQIFHALSREGGNLFFVGDLKQSIYRFRLADPGIFTEKSRRFDDPENNRGEHLIRLQRNFRSHKTILDAVNAVFQCCMSENLGDMDYSDKDALIPGTAESEINGRAELLLLSRETEDDTNTDAEAHQVAEEIQKLINSSMPVRGEEGIRPVRYGDIAILLRSANSLGGAWRRILISHGIPVAAGAGDDFFGALEVSVVFAMLSLLDNPHRDIPLLTVLTSPAFGFSPDQLSMIRAEHPELDFYSALRASEEQKAVQFLNCFDRLREEATDLNPGEMLERIVAELDLHAICSALPDGEQRIQHLLDLSEMASAYAHSGEHGLHRFVLWLERMEKKNLAPDTCISGENAVRIMSIHKSKGLEFPVVFYSGLGRNFNRADIRNPVLIHPQLGLGPVFTDEKEKTEYPTIARRAIENRLIREMLSEEMRLAYVAMTRAKDALLMTACVNKPDKYINEAKMLEGYRKIPAELLRDAVCPLQWLLPAVVNGSEIRLRISGRDKDNTSTPAYEAQIEERDETDSELLEKLETDFAFQYPWKESETLPSKITATELKSRMDSDSESYFLMDTGPQMHFDFPDRLSPARRGTAAHMVMQQIDLKRTESTEEIREEILRLKECDFLTEEEAASVDAERIREFFVSPLGIRLRKSEKVWREFRFSLLEDAANVLQRGENGDRVLLQGIIDCFFQEDNGLTLIDYKTDHVFTREQIRKRTEQYRIQLETYASALERIFGLPVHRKYVCFLLPSVSVEL